MYKVRFAHKAERDLREAKDYIAKHLLNPEAAYRLLDSTQKAVDSLSVFPKRNPLVREPLIASQGIRWTQVQQYLLFLYGGRKRKNSYCSSFSFGAAGLETVTW